MKLYENGAYLLNGVDIVEDAGDVKQILAAKTGKDVSKGKRQRIRLPMGFWKPTILPEIWKS